ncbi:hypothetical protein jhhlp_004044 [Lomentospora prolificans]|uniref:Uncharacterized protein n=1 Tax=Lomentospora prolificans TaxID=41688 RepID=A0A2N3NAG5_9PEZI|nr:hypothetical protein jhhlp_004044 [Lomentospora prolificans]
MAEEPTLPRLPAVSWDERTQSISTRTRKRVRLHGPGAPPVASTSSDPAFFSSDDDPSIENYTGVRRKKRLVGSWYEQQPAASSDSCFGDDVVPPPKPHRKFIRHFDSGVWMTEASDEGPSDADVPSLSSVFPPKTRLPQLIHHVGPKLSEAEAAARKSIQACIDEGVETVDLSDLHLQTISNDSIAPIATLAPIPVVTQDVPFEPKDPSVKLFLANNRLAKVPGSIFNLENLTLLSLRGNRIEELPDSIGNLRKLRELNVSQNRLRFLPSSLLKLLGPDSKLIALSVQLNPLLQLDPSFIARAREIDDAIDSTKISAITAYFVARSGVQYMASNGKRINETDLAIPIDEDSAMATPQKPEVPDNTCRAPSLMELTLRKCYHSSMLRELPDYLPDDSFQALREQLRNVLEQREAGGMHCAICGRHLITPAAQWIEWWGIKYNSPVGPQLPRLHDPDVVPFLNVGCSLACSPRKIKVGTTLEELRGGIERDV